MNATMSSPAEGEQHETTISEALVVSPGGASALAMPANRIVAAKSSVPIAAIHRRVLA